MDKDGSWISVAPAPPSHDFSSYVPISILLRGVSGRVRNTCASWQLEAKVRIVEYHIEQDSPTAIRKSDPLPCEHNRHRRGINDELTMGELNSRSSDADRIFSDGKGGGGKRREKRKTGSPGTSWRARFTRTQHLTTRDENHAPSVGSSVRRVERSLDPRNPGRSARSLRGLRSLARSSREPEVAVKNFPVDVWWPVYEARTAHFAVFGVSGVVHQRVYRGLGHGGMSPQRCRGARARVGRGIGCVAVRGRAGQSAPSGECRRGAAVVRGRSEVAVVVAVGG